MTLPSSFPLSVSQINVELNRNATDPFDIQGSAERNLAGVPSGAISFSDFLGKSSIGITNTFSSFAGGTTWNAIACGTPSSSRRVYIGIIHGFVSNNPGNNPTVTVDSVSATRIIANSTGGPSTPASYATGCGWFQANPSGSTCNISASWSLMSNLGVIVLATYGLTTVLDSEGDGGQVGFADGQVGLNTASKGAVIAMTTYSHNEGTVSWTELSKQQDWTLGWSGSTSNNGSLAWQLNQDGASHTFHVSPSPSGDGSYMSEWISLSA